MLNCCVSVLVLTFVCWRNKRQTVLAFGHNASQDHDSQGILLSKSCWQPSSVSHRAKSNNVCALCDTGLGCKGHLEWGCPVWCCRFTPFLCNTHTHTTTACRRCTSDLHSLRNPIRSIASCLRAHHSQRLFLPAGITCSRDCYMHCSEHPGLLQRLSSTLRYDMGEAAGFPGGVWVHVGCLAAIVHAPT